MYNKMFIFQFYILLGLISTLIISPYIIKTLRNFKAGQKLRPEGPSEHKTKEGTITMGGIAIFLPVFILTLVLCNFSTESLAIILVIFGFFMVGFLDDMLIITRGKNEGLKPKIKMLMQIIISLIFGVYLYVNGHKTSLNIPFTSLYIDIGLFYIPFLIFIMTGFSNAINLTDGLDGLAAGTTAISILPMVIILSFSEPNNLSSAAITCGLICIGTCIGFLWFNSHPASVFMGDTGSLALGGLFSMLGIVGNNELWLVITGIIFVIETLSVMIQVFYFKRTKKRIFLMSPLHHHYEKKGWKETKVTYRFYIIGIIASLLSVSGYLFINKPF